MYYKTNLLWYERLVKVPILGVTSVNEQQNRRSTQSGVADPLDPRTLNLPQILVLVIAVTDTLLFMITNIAMILLYAIKVTQRCLPNTVKISQSRKHSCRLLIS